MTIKDMIVIFALIGLFSIALISIDIGIANNNNANVSLLNSEPINRFYLNMNSSLSTLENNATVQKNASESDIPVAGYNSILTFSTFGSLWKVFSIISSVFSNIIVLITQVLGLNLLIISVLSSILVFILIFLIYRTLRSGE